MSMLIETYRRLKNSIVAFAPKFAPNDSEATRFPPIFGTGFVVHEDGLIATNDHVISSFPKLPRPDGKDWPVSALFFILTDNGMASFAADIGGVSRLSKFGPGQTYYGPPKPDIAFVHLKLRGLLPVALRPHGAMYEEGEEVATAGFPMGTDHLIVPGWLHQISPTLQSGIVSAIHPYPCTTPHGFTINVMTQGGASGSPIFNRETGEVIGAVYAGVFDIRLNADGENPQHLLTHYTYGVPSHFIVNSVAQVTTNEVFKTVREQAVSIRTFFERTHARNILTGQSMQDVKLPW
jgi:S1-C subfamily serine protease